ncbi:hypothetical protein BDV40DRAFT_153546 [Aspergillus tamarii]|uniref:SWIM-type domain-containing protein n=1 Tax=Aspergillus tamarii TaxID=41984 RepID=A0A5N6VA04_ASPTM|nr:hypothetical protein BDV40DRAFT_153546 [Aspergillus tamarii]
MPSSLSLSLSLSLLSIVFSCRCRYFVRAVVVSYKCPRFECMHFVKLLQSRRSVFP